jgi:hypothetical protein
LFVALAAACAFVAGCTTSATQPTVIAGWRAVSAPADGARVLAMTPVDGGLLVLGSVPGPFGRAPAAWTTTDGLSWHALSLQPHTAYAGQAEFVSVGVGGGRVTALGQAFGGAHSNPRLTIWSGNTTTGLVEYEQPFEMFGGPQAIAVNGAAALPGTALLIGQWDEVTGRYGAAVWTSPDGAKWTRFADDPALAAAPGEQTSALGATGGPDGFLVVGDVLRGASLAPLAWTSKDGKAWQRVTMPTVPISGQYGGAAAAQASCDGHGCAIIGTVTDVSQQAVCWPVSSANVGAPKTGPTAATAQVSQALVHGGETLAALRIDNVARLESISRDCTGWRTIPLPVRSDEVRVGALSGQLLLATTDETSSRLWLRAG